MKACSFFLVLALLSACKSKEQALFKDDELTVAVAAVTKGDVGSYQVKIMPEKKVLERLNAKGRTALQYQMDTCFSMRQGAKELLPVLVQAVANGQSDSFEYLVVFEGIEKQGDKELIYKDAYLNGRQYRLPLKEE